MRPVIPLAALALIGSPLLAQVYPDGPRPPTPRPDKGGGGGGIGGISIGISLGKKKPKAPPAPPMNMVDADIPDYVEGEALFFVKGDIKSVDRTARAAKITVIETTYLDELDETMVRAKIAPGDTVETAVARLKTQKGVTSAQPNVLYQLLGSSAREKGAGLHGIKLSDKSKVSGRILMIDSTIDTANAALKGAVITQQIFADNKVASAHGTAIAEILVGTGTAGGVAQGASLISLAAFEPAGEKTWLSTTAKLLKASNAAPKFSPNVVNLSFGAKSFDNKLNDMLDVFERKGICVAAAAGNDSSAVKFPARKSTVIAVTAVSGNGKTVYSAASKGPEVDVAAWGVGMLAATPDGWRTVSGTSFATAVVTGGLLRLNGCNGGAMPAATRTFIAGAAEDLGAKGPDSIFGAGLFRLSAPKKK